MKKNAHAVTDYEYLNRLKEQFDFLQNEIKEYENGKLHYSLKMAATLRIIFHNTKNSKPILPWLIEKYGYKLNFRIKQKQYPLDNPDVTFYMGFTVGKLCYRPDTDAPFFIDANFEDYWNEIVYKEGLLFEKTLNLVCRKQIRRNSC